MNSARVEQREIIKSQTYQRKSSCPNGMTCKIYHAPRRIVNGYFLDGMTTFFLKNQAAPRICAFLKVRYNPLCMKILPASERKSAGIFLGVCVTATILLIANDPDVTAMYAAAFHKKEYTVLTAHSGRQALAQVKTRLPDVIVLDATAPRLSVKRLARALRRDSNAILALLAQNPARVDGMNHAQIIVPKTIPPKKLAQRVRAALDNRPPREMRVGALTLNVERRRVTRGNRTHKLTPKEF
ncbi:response regulator transcription factor, partial [Anaerolineae bacterium CFX7]|nr:response regulator transcription factor [Anaerolineae bacterium CFX7]